MRGHTLVELVFVLILVGIGTSAVAPALGRQRDRALVLGAREAVVGILATARGAALASGGASVTITTSPARAEVRVNRATVRVTSLESEFGVSVALSGGATRTEIAFNGLGLGRMASETVTFRRGGESVPLVVSAYGRVRRP